MKLISIFQLRVFIIALSIIGSSITYATPEASPQNQIASSFSQLFSNSMNRPAVKNTFRKAQLQLLHTDVDRAFLNMFKSNDALKPGFSALLMASQLSVSYYDDIATANYWPVNENTTPGLKILDSTVKFVMSNLGYPQNVIDARSVYIAPGAPNASNVSSSPDKTVTVYRSGILEAQTPHELLGVTGHEFGHNLGQHGVIRMMNQFMLVTLAIVGTSGVPTLHTIANSSGQTDLNSIPIARKLLSRDSLLHSLTCPLHASNGYTQEQLSLADSIMQNAPYKMFIKQLLQNETAFHQALMEYIDLLAWSADVSELSSKDVEYWKNLKAGLVLGSQQPGLFKINETLFQKHAQNIIHMLSRAHEVTADKYGASITPNRIFASGFAKLSQVPFDLYSRGDVLTTLAEQGEKILAIEDRERKSRLLGTTHPASNIRIFQILNIDAYDTAVFANPLWRTLLLLTQIESDILSGDLPQSGSTAIDFIKLILESLKNKPIVDADKVKKLEDKLTTLESKKQDEKSILATEYRSISQQILTLLDTQVVSHVANEDVVVIENSPESYRARYRSTTQLNALAKKVNPRFRNLLEFYLLTKEMLLRSKSELEKISNRTNEQENSLKTLDAASKVVPRLIKSLLSLLESKLTTASESEKLVLEARILLINKMLNSQDADELKTMRQEIVKQDGGRIRIPTDGKAKPSMIPSCRIQIDPPSVSPVSAVQ